MKISVITVSYNSEKTLRDTIQSVLNQLQVEIEYIVVDGASTDGTLHLIKEYEPHFGGRMRWISEPDKGLYDVMNKGIRMATGEVVGMLNSDDFFTDSYAMHRVKNAFIQDPQLQAVYGDVHFVHPDNLHKCVRYYSSRIFRPWLMRFGFMPAHPSFYMKKKCYLDDNLYQEDYKIGADFELLLRFIYINRVSIRYLPFDLVTMRTGGASTGGLLSHRIIMKEHLRAFRENNIYTNCGLLSLQYFYKIWELVYYRFFVKAAAQDNSI